jgi:hypothetical protein
VFAVMSVRNIREDSLAEKRRQIETNPCFEEQKKSLSCIEVNSKDTDQCFREILNLKICRTFWYEIQKFRRNHNIEPILPEPSERDRMKAVYMSTGSLKPIFAEMTRDYNL